MHFNALYYGYYMKYTLPVVKGKGRGKAVVGFPTLNLKIPQDFDVKEGVYGCKVWLNGTEYLGALHYGKTPTFDDVDQALEIFILDYDPTKTPLDGVGDDHNPTEITFELGSFLRPVATFLNPQELRRQIALDVARIRRSMQPNNKS